ncbi:MAG: hypothetical protein ACD_56C00167G0009 [uncultured bacterium]|nr:MAG: hypothetical protein ACD_56C00167G0009 [uncultured bacterium]
MFLKKCYNENINKNKTMETKKISPKKVATKKSVKAPVKKVAAKKVAIKKAAVLTRTIEKSPAKKISKTKTMQSVKKVIEVKKTGHKHSKVKRYSYMTLSIIFGLLLGTFVQAFVELVYMRKSLVDTGMMKTNYFMGFPSYLPVFASVMFILGGLSFGIWLGFWGWKYVYIEHRHRTRRT